MNLEVVTTAELTRWPSVVCGFFAKERCLEHREGQVLRTWLHSQRGELAKQTLGRNDGQPMAQAMLTKAI